MSRLQERLDRIKAVEREAQAAAVAAALLAERLRADPAYLTPRLRARDGDAVIQNLEATYLVRLFAEFEAGLRDYWGRGLGRNSRPAMHPLMDRIAAMRQMPQPVLSDAHAVREYRNTIVREGERPANPQGNEVARRRLCVFLSRLPRKW